MDDRFAIGNRNLKYGHWTYENIVIHQTEAFRRYTPPYEAHSGFPLCTVQMPVEHKKTERQLPFCTWPGPPLLSGLGDLEAEGDPAGKGLFRILDEPSGKDGTLFFIQ